MLDCRQLEIFLTPLWNRPAGPVMGGCHLLTQTLDENPQAVKATFDDPMGHRPAAWDPDLGAHRNLAFASHQAVRFSSQPETLSDAVVESLSKRQVILSRSSS